MRGHTLAIVVAFLGYAVGSYGYVLVRGWDIPVKAWVDPVHPWQWPAGAIPAAAPVKVFP